MLSAILAGVCAVNGVLLLLVLWNAVAWPAPRRVGAVPGSVCSVLIPARNEESNLPGCLESVLQQGEMVLEVIVCDDRSSDGTAAVVEKAALRDPRIRLIRTDGLPEGWCGKPFACASLAAEAKGEWLLFLDADARLRPEALARIITEAEKTGNTLLSCWPGLDMESFWEKLLLPMLNFVVFTLYPAPLAGMRPADASLGLAHGACILARREEYQALGGHDLVRGELFEDTWLARAWRARGGSSLCLDGQDIVRVRMYDSLQGIWEGFLKNFYPAFRHGWTFWLFLGLHVSAFLLPFLLLPFLRDGAFLLAVIAAGSVLTMRLIQCVRFRYSVWPALLHPVAEAMLIALGIASWMRCRSGRGVVWKGRRYLPGGRLAE